RDGHVTGVQTCALPICILVDQMVGEDCIDVVYQHVDAIFPYHLVYENAGLPSPMIGGFGPFGPEIDFSQEFAREYVQTANFHWRSEERRVGTECRPGVS